MPDPAALWDGLSERPLGHAGRRPSLSEDQSAPVSRKGGPSSGARARG